MKKILLIIGAIVIALIFFAVIFGGSDDSGEYAEYPTEAPEYDQSQDYGESGGYEYDQDYYSEDSGSHGETSYRPQGSVNTVEGKTVLVTLLSNDGVEEWSDDEISYVAHAQQAAADYIMDQARAHGKNSEIIVWSEENQDLCYDAEYQGIHNDLANLSNGSNYDVRLQEIIERSVPIDEITKKYGTDSIGFVFMIDGNPEDTSFTYSYEAEGYYSDYYYEICNMYMYDCDMKDQYESVPAFAHEICHLFGAIDLYETEGNESCGVTSEIRSFIESEYPTELMYDTYEPNGSINHENVTQVMSDITLAKLGLIDAEEVSSKYPTIDFRYPGVFGNGSDFGSY